MPKNALLVTGWLMLFSVIAVETQAQNIAVTNRINASNMTITGTIDGGTFSGTLSSVAQASITLLGSLTALTASGTIVANNFSSTTTGGIDIGTGGVDVGGSITATGTIRGRFISSTSSGLSAAGTTQGTATVLSNGLNVITTVTSSANGVVLFTPVVGETVTIVNKGASTLLVYPASGNQIDALGNNVAMTLPVDGSVILRATSTTQWYSNANKATGIFSPSVNGTSVTTPNNVTTEQDMMTYTLPANTLKINNQTIRIKVFGTTSAANNAKTVRVYFGGTVVFTAAITANSANNWSAEVLIVRTGASTQTYSGTGLFNQTIQTQTQGTLAISETSDIIIKTTGQAATSGQTVTQRAMIIELINDR